MHFNKHQTPTSPAHLLLAELKAKFPVFGKSVPLTIGIDKKIIERLPEIDRKLLRVALGIHTKSTRYLRNTAKATARVDLDGHTISEVTELHRTHAQGLLNQRAKKADERRAQADKAQQEAEQAAAAQKHAEQLALLVNKFSRDGR